MIAAAKEAEAAGATKPKYEAFVTTTTEGGISLVIPAGPVIPGLSGKLSQQVGSKVTIEVDDLTAAAAMTPLGQKFLLDLQSMEAQLLQ